MKGININVNTSNSNVDKNGSERNEARNKSLNLYTFQLCPKKINISLTSTTKNDD